MTRSGHKRPIQTPATTNVVEVDPSKLQEAPDPSKVGTLKYPLLTHENVDTRPTKNIKMKQYLCVKEALPKTRLTNAILYENVSQDRHLEMTVSSITHRKGRTLNTMDINKRAFMAQQDRKKRKWKREDEVRLSGMNLPSLSPVQVERRPSIDVMYHSSDNEGRSDSASVGRKPILPMMKVRKERTEIVLHHDRTFITKLPSFVEIDHNIQTVFDAYRGKSYLARDLASRDERFTRLQTMLQPLSSKRSDEMPIENLTAKSRMLKYNKNDSPTSSEPIPLQYAEARVMIASRGQSRDNPRSAPNVEYVTEKKTAPSTCRAEILNSFKTQDIKELSKSLTRESHIDLGDIRGAPLHRRESNVSLVSKKPGMNLQHIPSLGLKYETQ